MQAITAQLVKVLRILQPHHAQRDTSVHQDLQIKLHVLQGPTSRSPSRHLAFSVQSDTTATALP